MSGGRRHLRFEAKGSQLLGKCVGHAVGLEVCFSHLCQPTRRKGGQQDLVSQEVCLLIADLHTATISSAQCMPSRKGVGEGGGRGR